MVDRHYRLRLYRIWQYRVNCNCYFQRINTSSFIIKCMCNSYIIFSSIRRSYSRF